MSSTIPGALHEQIRQEIIRRVAENEYKPGKPLPSTAEFADEFGVSAITVKRALRDLQPMGILRTVPGLGTFVRETRRFVCDLDFTSTSPEGAKQSALGSTVEVTSVTRERISNPAFKVFGVAADIMHCVRSIISAEGMPILLDTSYVPLSLGSKIINEFEDKSLGDVLRGRGMRFNKKRLLVDAGPASKEVQHVFGIPNGFPTLRRLYQLTTYDPFFSVYGIAESPFDRLACRAELVI
ncbi:GntR family transcriptional regulator